MQDSVGEDSSLENKNKLVMPVESLPTSAGGLSELEHHGEAGLPRAAPLRTAMPRADRREGALDGVGRPQVVIRRAKTGQSSAPKTGHRVGGIGWKNRLVRTCLQGA